MYIVSYKLKDEKHCKRKLELNKFFKLFKSDKKLKYMLLKPFLSGLTFSSGVLLQPVKHTPIESMKTSKSIADFRNFSYILKLLFKLIYI